MTDGYPFPRCRKDHVHLHTIPSAAREVSGGQNFGRGVRRKRWGDTQRLAKGQTNELLQFGRIVSFNPPAPASFEDIDLGKSFFYEYPCHTGTGSFVRSGSVEHECFVARILVCPGFHIPWVFPRRALDFSPTGLPLLRSANIKDDHIGVPEHRFELFLCNPGDVKSYCRHGENADHAHAQRQGKKLQKSTLEHIPSPHSAVAGITLQRHLSFSLDYTSVGVTFHTLPLFLISFASPSSSALFS